MSLEEKKKLADFIIENNGDLEELRKQVRDLWEKIQKQAEGSKQKGS